MASLKKEDDRGRVGWRLRFYLDKKRKSLWLGSMSKRAADAVARHIDELARAYAANMQPEPDAARWAAGLDGRIRQTLAGWGLLDSEGTKAKTDAGRLLGPFLDAYIVGRTDCGAGTITNFKQVRRLLVEHFGEDHPLKAITSADADRWRRWLLARPVRRDTEGNVIKTMAAASVSKHIKRAKTMFDEAVKDRLLAESPFANQKGGTEANKDRHHFVDRAVSAIVLDACPDHDWRLIFALPRFGGLRCPSEVTGLKWSDVLWDTNRLRIDSPKTGLRFCPIFPELLPVLTDAFHAAPDGATYCVQRYRGDVNLATQLHRIITGAGQKTWPKTFINLRSTRRTELQEAFPSHVVDEWLGHSTKTAETHYLQVTPDHWELGASKVTGSPIQIGGPTGGPIGANPQASTPILTQKNPAFPAVEASETLGNCAAMTPTGFEPVLPP